MTSFADRLAFEITEGWAVKARANQLPPEDGWSIWLLLAGRGFGKTRVLSEMANSWAASGRYKRLALVAATAADARAVVVSTDIREHPASGDVAEWRDGLHVQRGGAR